MNLLHPDRAVHVPTNVRSFAQTHSHFFGDEALEELFAARWRSPRPRRSGA
jgi:hypothetical protein